MNSVPLMVRMMYFVSNRRYPGTVQAWTVWSAYCFILGLSTVRGAYLSACGNDGIKEVMTGQTTNFTCVADGNLEWRLVINDIKFNSYNLATCKRHVCNHSGLFDDLFNVSIIDDNHKLLVINSISNKTLDPYLQILNGSVECTTGQDMYCNLSYVALPENVSCSATNMSWSVHVSCVIGSIYSSRRIYKCHLFRLKSGSENKSFVTVTMVTSPTSERITESEVKMSGSCEFNTTLPPEEGKYSFSVSVSPGRRNYSADFAAHQKWIGTRLPHPPRVSCDPQHYVLENTDITCTCSTTSLGQPAGYLRWIVGNKTNQGKEVSKEHQIQMSQEIHHTQSLSLPDHETTWFRCDVLWGLEQIRGDNYTAVVGYAARSPRFSLNGHVNHLIVSEGEEINFTCESEGRPPPQMYIYNSENGEVIWENMSLINYTLVADCTHTGTYSCSSWNKYSSQLNVTSPISLTVKCKPHRFLSTSFCIVDIEQETVNVNFEVISNPSPFEFRLWDVKENERSREKVQSSVINVTCKSDTKRPYLSRCTLTVFNSSFQETSGLQKIQLKNEIGYENFTVKICHGKCWSGRKLTRKSSQTQTISASTTFTKMFSRGRTACYGDVVIMSFIDGSEWRLIGRTGWPTSWDAFTSICLTFSLPISKFYNGASPRVQQPSCPHPQLPVNLRD